MDKGSRDASCLRRGNLAFRDGDYKSAIAFYERALSESPEISPLLRFNIEIAARRFGLGFEAGQSSDLDSATAVIGLETLSDRCSAKEEKLCYSVRGEDAESKNSILDAIWEHYASKVEGLLARRPSFRFDPEWYGARIGSAKLAPNELEKHYRLNSSSIGISPTFYTEHVASSSAMQQALARLVVQPKLAELITEGTPDALHLAAELIRLRSPIDVEISNFSNEFYLELHPDIDRAGVDPLLHYLRHGVIEGRRSLSDLRKSQYKGGLAYSADRPTCLICVHEMSRTGAPIVGLELARGAAKSHNVVIMALRGGFLLNDFRKTACEVLISEDPLTDFDYFSGNALQNVDLSIINSIETAKYVPFLVAKDIPFAAYIHEYAEYTDPGAKSVLPALFADLLVFSSQHLRNSWNGRLSDICFNVERDSIVLPQKELIVGGCRGDEISAARSRLSARVGRDLTDVKLICGAGHMQWRKGTDIFAMTAQVCRETVPDAVFVWIGDGLNVGDLHFGIWIDYHLRQVGANQPDGNLFFISAGSSYQDVLIASDVMFLASRLDPLPNVVFDALKCRCKIIQFDKASGFSDSIYRESGFFVSVEYANPAAAAAAISRTQRKRSAGEGEFSRAPEQNLFEAIWANMQTRPEYQSFSKLGKTSIKAPLMFSDESEDSPMRVREREKMFRYGRRLIWRDLDEVKKELVESENWIHRHLRLAPYSTSISETLPPFAIHIHAFYTGDLAEDVKRYGLYRYAQRIVVTTDTSEKESEIRRLMSAEGLHADVVRVPNIGRDILPFMQLFDRNGVAGSEEIWCHLHQKKSISTTNSGDVWRRFLMRILLGDGQEISVAPRLMADPSVGLVAAFDPYFLGWNESRRLLPKFAHRLPGPLPENPLLFPVGNMFWIRRSVVLAMNSLFGRNYSWPNEPIADDGTEFHLIERLWPAMASQLGLQSVFVHKMDQKRA